MQWSSKKEAVPQRNSRCLYADRGMRASSGLPCRSVVTGDETQKTVKEMKAGECMLTVGRSKQGEKAEAAASTHPVRMHLNGAERSEQNDIPGYRV